MNFLVLLIVFLATAQPLKILYRNTTYYPVASYSIDQSTWIRLRDFASILKFEVKYDASLRRMELRNSSHTISLYGENSFVEVDDKLLNLPHEIKLRDGNLFISVPQLQYLFGDILQMDFDLGKDGRELWLYDREVVIEEMKIHERSDTTELLVHTSAPLQFSAQTGAPGSVILALSRCRLRGNLSPPQPKGSIHAVHVVPKEDAVLIDVSVPPKTRAFSARRLGGRPGLSLIFVTPRRPPLREEDDYGKIRRIVIDPGHGGKDPGAVGPSGLLEKNVNLEVSRTLKELLESRLDVQVILTREDDHFLPLSERARIANESSADLFISVHCNAAPPRRRSSGGVETYFLSVARTDEARAVEARENASIKFELDGEGGYNFDDVSLILWDLAQSEFLEESQMLAESVQKQLVQSVPVDDRGINQAGFFVLNGVYMPSILIECAFISNKREESLLKSNSFRQKLAEGIFKGVAAFKKQLEARSAT
jgi:N-acetylmuramoyl-L-alanine amidase